VLVDRARQDAPGQQLELEPLAHDRVQHLPRLQVLDPEVRSGGDDLASRGLDPEHLIEVLAGVHLDHQHAAAGLRQLAAEHGGHRGLPHATFAGDDEELAA
jgi:hypothetical protein